MRSAHPLSLAALLLLAACGGGSSDPDGGKDAGARDAVAMTDALPGDTGAEVRDGSESADTGETIDTGQTADTGESADIGETADTGESADIGETADTGESADAGQTADTGESADAGESIDAGQTADAGFGDASCTPTGPEVCDHQDNDCDGLVDNVDVGNDGITDCLRIALVGNAGLRAASNFLTWLGQQGT